MKNKAFCKILFVSALLAFLTACASPAPSTPASRIEEIRREGVLVIATATTPPFEFYDEETGELTGYDIELASLIAQELGATIEWRVLAFADLLTALQAGSVDMVIAAMYITPEREALVDFSQAYLDTGLVMVVRNTSPLIADPSEMAGLRVGVKEGATGERWIDTYAATGEVSCDIFRYQDTRDSLDDLEQGFLDIVLNDHINTLVYMQDHPLVRIGSEVIAPASLGIAVRQGDQALLDAINDVLAALDQSGQMDDLFERWIEP